MSESLSLTVIARIKDRVHAFVADYRKHLKGRHYIDVRRVISEAKGGYTHNSTATWKPAMRGATGIIAAPGFGRRCGGGRGMIAVRRLRSFVMGL
jgi:hypothetical protein